MSGTATRLEIFNKAAKLLTFLICAHIIVCCVSLVVTANEVQSGFLTETFHVFFDTAQWNVGVTAVAAFAIVASVFVISRFSFGYFVGFYSYTMIGGFLWLNSFTDLNYDHRLAGFSAAASAVTFLLPALFISSPVRQIVKMTPASFDRLLWCILLLSAATIAIGASYNFQPVSPAAMQERRAEINSPTIMNYLLTIASSALLPFAFASFVATKAYWRAATVLILLLLFYPITLTKIAIFTPVWLVFMLVLSRLFEAKIAVVLSLLAPMIVGLVLFAIFKERTSMVIFSIVNFRMVQIPSVAMEIYSDFFASHNVTHFCQISFLKPIMQCPYPDQLSILMQRTYKLGYFNASLFATEGIASVGFWLAPLATFLCGLIIALGNRLSAGLPAEFILVSGAVLPQMLLNIPLTTVLLSHGAGFLFLLWYVTPRSLFEETCVARVGTVSDSGGGLPAGKLEFLEDR
jgi:hypothetical protein